jgi:hypothetical protein
MSGAWRFWFLSYSNMLKVFWTFAFFSFWNYCILSYSLKIFFIRVFFKVSIKVHFIRRVTFVFFASLIIWDTCCEHGQITSHVLILR